MTLQNIWDKMNLRRTGNTTADLNFQRMVTEWANETINEIWTGKGLDYNPNWWYLGVSYTFATVADQVSYELPTSIDGNKVFSLRQREDSVKLKFFDQHSWDETFPNPNDHSGGNPLWYTIYGRDSVNKNPYIRLLPIPSSIITMYIRYFTVMTYYDNATATSTVLLPDKYDTVLLDGILYKWYEFDPERGNAQSKMASFMEGITKADQDNKYIDDDMISNSHSDGKPYGLGFATGVGT